MLLNLVVPITVDNILSITGTSEWQWHILPTSMRAFFSQDMIAACQAKLTDNDISSRVFYADGDMPYLWVELA